MTGLPLGDEGLQSGTRPRDDGIAGSVLRGRFYRAEDGGAVNYYRRSSQGVLDLSHDLHAEGISSSIRNTEHEPAVLEKRIKNRDKQTRGRVKQPNNTVSELTNLFSSQRLLRASETAPPLQDQGLRDELLGTY